MANNGWILGITSIKKPIIGESKSSVVRWHVIKGSGSTSRLVSPDSKIRGARFFLSIKLERKYNGCVARVCRESGALRGKDVSGNSFHKSLALVNNQFQR